MKPTEILKEEHVAIKSMLDVLERICDKLEAGEGVEPGHLEQVVEFIREFADKCHHGKEEDLLFPAMAEAGIPVEGGPIGVMLAEHETGRNYVKGMREGIEEYKEGRGASRFIENARGYIELLRAHIDKEDNILYPMADGHVAREEQERLLEEFEKVEERMGKGTHERYLGILERLKGIYLRS